jgi:hypothetical protein
MKYKNHSSPPASVTAVAAKVRGMACCANRQTSLLFFLAYFWKKPQPMG